MIRFWSLRYKSLLLWVDMQSANFFNFSRKISFSLLILYPQANFLMPGFGKLLFGFGVFLFVLGWRGGNFISHGFLKYIGLFFAFLLMHCLLFLFGQAGDFPPRPLYLTGIAVLVLLFSASILSASIDGFLWVSRSVMICLAVELFIVISQFTYLTYGFGLAPKEDESLLTGFLTGSYGNPNNVAVMITLQVFVLYKTGFLMRQPILSNFVIFSAFGAVFLTMSRTCFVLFSVFILIYYIFDKKGGQKNIKLISAARSVLAVALASLAVWYFNYMDSSGDSIVWGRSLERLMTVSDIGSDDSVDFRWVSHMRLIENLDNLGFGSFSDFSYHKFFHSYDFWLMKVNPHSFLVEMAFLYGYVGFVLALAFMSFVVFDLIKSGLSTNFFLLFVVSFVFFQMIPSSVLGNPVFFVLCVILGSYNFSIRYSKNSKFF